MGDKEARHLVLTVKASTKAIRDCVWKWEQEGMEVAALTVLPGEDAVIVFKGIVEVDVVEDR